MTVTTLAGTSHQRWIGLRPLLTGHWVDLECDDRANHLDSHGIGVLTLEDTAFGWTPSVTNRSSSHTRVDECHDVLGVGGRQPNISSTGAPQ
jgi:hypothetical protein